jgi:hypothetical protein
MHSLHLQTEENYEVPQDLQKVDRIKLAQDRFECASLWNLLSPCLYGPVRTLASFATDERCSLIRYPSFVVMKYECLRPEAAFFFIWPRPFILYSMGHSTELTLPLATQPIDHSTQTSHPSLGKRPLLKRQWTVASPQRGGSSQEELCSTNQRCS